LGKNGLERTPVLTAALQAFYEFKLQVFLSANVENIFHITTDMSWFTFT